MDPIYTTIQRLEKKLYHVKEQYVQQQGRVTHLEKENEKLSNALAKQQAAYRSMPSPLLLSDLLSALPTDDPKFSRDILKKQFEQYIQYIDECIFFIKSV
jgi:hypothetical protein